MLKNSLLLLTLFNCSATYSDNTQPSSDLNSQLLSALQAQPMNTAQVTSLIQQGASVNASLDCMTPLSLAIQAYIFQPGDDLSLITFLVEKGADVNATTIFNGSCPSSKSQSRNPRTPHYIPMLTSAIWLSQFAQLTGQPDLDVKSGTVVALLLKHGADINKVSTAEWAPGQPIGTALGAAALLNSKNITQQLIAAGADVKNDTQAVANAVQQSSFDVLKILIDNGVDLTKVSVKGKTYKDLIIDQKNALKYSFKKAKEQLANYQQIKKLFKQFSKPKPTVAPKSVAA